MTRSVGRAIVDASLTVGMARGVTHGQQGGSAGHDLLARSIIIGEGRRDYDDRTARPGFLDRVPGWVFIVLVLGLMAVAVVYWSQ